MSDERGSAPIESTFALLLLLLLVLGTIEVAFALYGRNVILSSAHEAARAGIELGRSPEESEAIAKTTMLTAAGGIVDDMDIGVRVLEQGSLSIVAVHVEGTVDAWGPLPFPFRVATVASASTDRVAP